MLSTLLECIDIYETLTKNRYILTLENGDVIRLQFSNKHFHHLVGLHKLTDIPQVQKKPGKQSTSVIYKMLVSKKIDDKAIKRSAFYSKIKTGLHISIYCQSCFLNINKCSTCTV